MDPLKVCNLCGCNSNETAIFSCTYAKGDMHVCLECLSDGILEIVKPQKKKQETVEFMPLEEFDLTVPEEVFGFNCENCGSVLFANNFPIPCECGHMNTDTVLRNQNIMNRKQ